MRSRSRVQWPFMPPSRVVAVVPDSPAAELGLAIGDELLSVNGEQLRDVIRYQLQTDEEEVALEIRRGGIEQTVQISKAPGTPLGLELDSAVFDRVRTCDNHCPFCFIYQLPKGMRKSLYLKDDDYRLSFLYGNFTTLTRFTEADFERVVTEHLSPMYVSIHATDLEVRAQLLRNRRGATSLRWLELLLEEGIEIHGQIVVCPGINDGDILDDTLRGILDRFSGLKTLGVVPLGLSAHSNEPSMRPHTREEAERVLDIVGEWQSIYRAVLGHHMVDASDEYYLMAQRSLPDLAHYGECLQHENGIGMIATLHAEVAAALRGEAFDGTGPKSGFFAWVDGAPAQGYRAPRENQVNRKSTIRSAAATNLAPDRGPESAISGARTVRIVTGEFGAQALAPVLPALRDFAEREIELLPIRNAFFGGTIGVTGLLTSADVAAAIRDVPNGDRIMIPDVMLSRGKFLDGGTVAGLDRIVEVVATNGAALVEAVCR